MTDELQNYLDHPDVFRTLLSQTSIGNSSTVPALRELMTVPGLSTQIGDIHSHLEQKLLDRMTKTLTSPICDFSEHSRLFPADTS